ncbi:MAG: glycosyltransferase [Acidobacteria bacterium]|nr:glycosyltransferase [Acidobacteriota bacterium]
MRILMLAPQPFFEPRGTPFSEYHRIKALVELGHTIDLVTYPFGRDVSLPNLRIIRAARPPLVRTVAIGPSFRKLLLDMCLAVAAWRTARQATYDVVHSHEEAGLLGVWLASRLGVPHVYDMHSSLPQQLTNFGYSRSRVLQRHFEAAERRMVERSQVIITVCQQLLDAVRVMGVGQRAVLIENVMGGDFDQAAAAASDARSIRARWQVGADEPLVLYTGTLETYQGVDLLLSAAAILRRSHPRARVMIVGGTADQVSGARAKAARRSVDAIFTGQRPAQEIADFVAASDILVSPRIAGTNTPLKIYSYLRSKRPIVATDLPTHTQVLTPDIAVLVPPDAAPFAAALGRLIDRPDERAAIAERAAAFAATRYSRDVFIDRTREAYEKLRLVPGGAPGLVADRASRPLPDSHPVGSSRR